MNSLDLKAAAKFIGCHPVTLAERTAAGVIPGAKIGKEWQRPRKKLSQAIPAALPFTPII